MSARPSFLSTLALCAILLLAAVPAPAEEAWPHPRDLTFPELVLEPPASKRVELPSGMIVHLLEDHELPVFKMTAVIKVGSWLEPDEKLGLAAITGSVMRTGGTSSMTGDAINEELEFIAGSVETSIGQRSGSASVNVLSKDIDLGLKIYADILMNPVFAQDKVDLAKNQTMESIRRRNDEPGPIARREFNSVLHEGHPFGRVETLETVDSITREDLVAFHRKYFFPNNIILGVAGDFDEKEILAKIEKAFAGWPKGEPPADPPDVPLRFEQGVYLVEKDVPQSNIRMGHVGIHKKDPDHFALEVMNFILGGSGFTSRLMREIRSNRGLAYSVGSYFTAGQERGSFGMVCETKSRTTVEAIEAMQQLAHSMTAGPVTPEELKIAKDSILNSFVFQFQSAGQIVGNAVSLEYQGLPPDYLQIYQKNISEMTAEKVLEVAREHLHPDKLILMVVGEPKSFDRPLATLGKVQKIPLEDFSEFYRKKAAAAEEKKGAEE